MSEEHLDRWERITQAATEGPWSAADEHELLDGAEPAWCVSRMRPRYDTMSETEGYMYDIAETMGTNEQADAEFIAMAREALPILLREVRKTEREQRWANQHLLTVMAMLIGCTVDELVDQMWMDPHGQYEITDTIASLRSQIATVTDENGVKHALPPVLGGCCQAGRESYPDPCKWHPNG